MSHVSPSKMDPVSLTIFGELASKSNSRKLVTVGGRPRFIKSDKAREFEEVAQLQIRPQHRVNFECPLRLEATIYYASRRPDLDCSLLQDVLERAGVFKNDRQIEEIHLTKKIDPSNPRVEVKVIPLLGVEALQ